MKPLREKEANPCPWLPLDGSGSNLAMENFLTLKLRRLGNAGQRVVTTRYLEPFGLKPTEWRTLAALADFAPLPFSRLVEITGSDKALLSRALRQLYDRGLASSSRTSQNGRRVVCDITPAGRELFNNILPIAQQWQAELLAVLSDQERFHLYRALQKLEVVLAAKGEHED